MNTEATKNYFDNLAENWDNMCHHDAKKIDAIITLAQLPENSRILDIATGTGVLIPRLLETNPQKIVAIDLSKQMLSVASKKYPDTRVHFQAADFYGFESDGFDFAIAYSAYPHFENKSLFCGRLSACLKSGGRFMIAHSESKETINGRHSGQAVRKVSTGLRDAQSESQIFSSAFNVDITVDTAAFYILSGTKK
ncbi:class I SAM-dependent methyltransferase [Eubacterium sp. AM05-23]|uniref:Class I SAM-dependent methyltransferase n=1 Tax=Eubacterium maltosivorans TaxID=2041044 RepID=A0A4V1GM59_EUBML|nr:MULTISPECIES: class I SAM-dependent methyltransferase [Eubacterium]QCT72146.1 class I SAM-dependent methyltransferase [Eubacterium maltosivorans]RHO58406.1 class I SAM-dependent methyltransferase [Eubacterium sp. AM05-23]